MNARSTETGRARAGAEMTLTLPSDREILLTRFFQASPAWVFKASTEPEHLAHWWGPRGYMLTRCEVDLRPGGAWRFVQRAPGGGLHAFRGVYREIVPPERIVQTFEYEPMPGYISLETVTLRERDGGTWFENLTRFWTVEDRDGMLKSGMEKGAAESMERLAEHLGVMR